MIYRAENPDLSLLFNHGATNTTPLNLIFSASGAFQWELNSFLTKVGGGANSYGARPSYATVSGYVTVLNVFQRFLDSRHKTLLEVDDDLLYAFKNDLQRHGKANNSTIIRTIRRVLAALEHTQNENPFHNLLTVDFTPGEFQVHATEEYYTRRGVRYLSHACIHDLRPTPLKSVSFIRSSQIDAWHEAINHYTQDPYVRKRWYIFSLLLEYTGSRISEVLEIPASAMISAYESLPIKTKEGRIEGVPVLKGKYKGAFRTALIPRAELQEIYKFIKNNHKLFPAAEIHDRIFINSKTGLPLARSTFNSYYSKVLDTNNRNVNLLGISHHNFRHRYFTILIAKHIANQPTNSAGNRLDIAMGVGIKDSLHASKSTLATYVHLAEDPDIQKAIGKVAQDGTDKLAQIRKLKSKYGPGKLQDSIFDEILGIFDE